MINDSKPKLIFVGDRYHDLINKTIQYGNHNLIKVITLDNTLDNEWKTYKDLIFNNKLLEFENEDSNEIALLVYTAGTTGTPKAVILKHSSFCEFAYNNLDPADMDYNESTLLSVPLYHVAGIQTAISGIYSGRTTVIQDQFESLDWMKLVQHYEINRVMLVPTMIKQIIDNENFDNYNFGSLNVITYGAAPMPISVLEESFNKFKDAKFINAFGQTETAATITALGPEDHDISGTEDEKSRKLKRLTSIGKPLPDIEVRIVDENGKEAPVNGVGEIVAKGERIMSGYWNNAKATMNVIKNGWLYTGDLGYRDEDGYIYLAGRAKDFIKRGGEMISPEEIEQLLYRHPNIEEVAVIGLPDIQWGEIVTAVIKCKKDKYLTDDDILAFCNDKLASFKRPEKIIFISELPRNSMGKILKKDLRDKFSV
jgi:acyl-CoA synthetase (AMP-forming)/AMP-acid ligase II